MAAARILGVAIALIGAASAAHGVEKSGRDAPSAQALRALDTGQWEVRERGEDAHARRICVSDLRHGAKAVSITYDCAAAGNGRTDLRVETDRLVQIRSQGVADGAPFAFDAEARRLGPCKR